LSKKILLWRILVLLVCFAKLSSDRFQLYRRLKNEIEQAF